MDQPIMYAMKAKRVDLALITFLNGGIVPDMPKGNQWFLFKVEEDGSAVDAQVLSYRELIRDFDVEGQPGHSPNVIRVKRCFSE